MSTRKYFYQFAVMRKGKLGTFPIDMLRHDQCFPMSEADSERITASAYHHEGDGAPVRLCAVSHVRYQPTEGRWESFGWLVVPMTFERV